MTATITTDTKRINYKSDFDFVARLMVTAPDGTTTEIGFPDYDWEMRITTGCNGYSQFVASAKGGKLTNCMNDDGQLRIICNNHGLRAGVLYAEFHAHLPNSIYPDGEQLYVGVSQLPIELVLGEGDEPTDIEIQMALPYIYDSAYDQAVRGGYEGTQEEYFALVSQLPDAVEIAIEVGKKAEIISQSAEKIQASATTIGEGARAIKTNADTLTSTANKVEQAAVKVEQAVESLSESASSLSDSATKLASVTDSATSLENSATSISTNTNALTTLISDWADGKAKIADALTRKYSPTETTESFDAMAQKVMDLPLAVEGQEGIIDHTANGIIDGYDLLNELHKHQRQDYPYCCGVEFVPYLYKTVVLSGAEAYLCSDGFFTTEQEVEHTFAEDNKLSHYIIYYYTYPTYQVPTTINPASQLIAYNGQPRFNLSNYYCPIVRSYTNERYSVGSSDITANNFSYIADIMLSGIETFGGVIGVTSSNSNILSVNLPHAKNLVSGGYVARQLYHLKNLCLASLEQVNGGIVASSCDALTTLELPNLTEVNGGFIVINTGPQIIRLPKLKYCNGNIIHQYQIKGAEMAHIYIPQISGTIYWGSVGGSNFNIAVHLGSQQEDNIKIATSTNYANRFTIVTVELGFRSSLDLHFWTYISAETLQGIIDNLADNNDYEPLTLTLGTTLKNKLSEEYIAIATAKNYNIA